MNAVRLVRQRLNTAPDSAAGDGFLERLGAARAEFTQRDG